MFKRIYVELSNYCNLNCIFCTPTEKNSRMMSLEQYKNVINQIKNYTKEVCLHVLGEPLIHPDFSQIVKYTIDNDIDIMLSTNSRLIPKLKNELINLKIKTWNLSLHSTYDMKNQEEFILELLDFIKLYQEKYEATFHLRLWAESNKLIKASNDKIRKILFDYYKYDGEILPRIRLKERVILAYEEEFEWPKLDGIKTDGYCLGGKSHVAILANGNAVLCCLDAKGYTTFGNVFNNSFSNIIRSEDYLHAINEFRNNRCYYELCSFCTYKNRRIKK